MQCVFEVLELLFADFLHLKTSRFLESCRWDILSLLACDWLSLVHIVHIVHSPTPEKMWIQRMCRQKADYRNQSCVWKTEQQRAEKKRWIMVLDLQK